MGVYSPSIPCALVFPADNGDGSCVAKGRVILDWGLCYVDPGCASVTTYGRPGPEIKQWSRCLRPERHPLHECDWLPAIGYQRNREIDGVGVRRQYGLARRSAVPSLDDPSLNNAARRIRIGEDPIT